MAKNASKTSKTKVAVAVASVFDSAVASCESAFLPILTGFAASLQQQQAEAASRSKAAVAAIGTLFAALPDPEDYKRAVVALFGNGLRGKAKEAGSLSAKLDAKAPVTIRAFLSQCRTVASSWTAPGVKDAAEKSGVRAGYDAAKPKAEAEVKADAAKAEAKPITLPELIGQMIGTLGGDVSVLKMVESALIAAKKPIHAQAVHDAAVKIASLAA